MKTRYTLALVGLLSGLLSAPLTNAQQPQAAEAEPTEQELAEKQKAWEAKIESFGWTRSGSAQIGTMAQIAIPQGWRFTAGNGTRELLKLYGNIPGDSELGMLAVQN